MHITGPCKCDENHFTPALWSFKSWLLHVQINRPKRAGVKFAYACFCLFTADKTMILMFHKIMSQQYKLLRFLSNWDNIFALYLYVWHQQHSKSLWKVFIIFPHEQIHAHVYTLILRPYCISASKLCRTHPLIACTILSDCTIICSCYICILTESGADRLSVRHHKYTLSSC